MGVTPPKSKRVTCGILSGGVLSRLYDTDSCALGDHDATEHSNVASTDMRGLAWVSSSHGSDVFCRCVAAAVRLAACSSRSVVIV